MKKIKRSILPLLLIPCLMVIVVTSGAWAQEKTHYVTASEFATNKRFFDDPRPLFKQLDIKKLMDPAQYAKLSFSVEAMKQAWAEIVGFRSVDIVGKISPDIKPGTYTYKDKEKYPGLKKLMIPGQYDRFNPGAPPYAGNFPEIKIVPTRQYYWALPIAEASKKYAGTVKLDPKGYLIEDSFTAGYPFPRPAGDFKAQQAIYNWVKRYLNGEDFYLIEHLYGFTKELKTDYVGAVDWWEIKLQGRVLNEPYGWFDERAKTRGENSECIVKYLAPRDSFGTVFSILYYTAPEKMDQFLIYVNVLRRLRRMSSSDTQDAVGGQDTIFDDKDLFAQKLSPTHYPYKIELVDEREYLVPSPSIDGSVYMSSKGLEYHNIDFERRPLYVIKMTQLDKNYVYGKRILYIDKETFALIRIENYDQKGRLYRTGDMIPAFDPQRGIFSLYEGLLMDHIDLHSGRLMLFVQPAPGINRSKIDMGSLFKTGK